MTSKKPGSTQASGYAECSLMQNEMLAYSLGGIFCNHSTLSPFQSFDRSLNGDSARCFRCSQDAQCKPLMQGPCVAGEQFIAGVIAVVHSNQFGGTLHVKGDLTSGSGNLAALAVHGVDFHVLQIHAIGLPIG